MTTLSIVLLELDYDTVYFVSRLMQSPHCVELQYDNRQSFM